MLLNHIGDRSQDTKYVIGFKQKLNFERMLFTHVFLIKMIVYNFCKQILMKRICYASKCDRCVLQLFGISYHKDNSFRGTIRGKNDEVVKCSMGERSIRFNVNKFSGCILETVSRQSTKDIHGWVSDERTVYPSRVINQEIDNCCLQKMQKFLLKRGKWSFLL